MLKLFRIKSVLSHAKPEKLLFLSTNVTLKQQLSNEPCIQNLIIRKYDELVNNGTLKEDLNQRKIVEKLNEFQKNFEIFYDEHSKAKYKSRIALSSSSSIFSKLFVRQRNEIVTNLKGVYLYGGVGCGKTMLMDLTYDHISNNRKKLRMHFNKFMLDVHKRIHKIKINSNVSDPIPIVAEQLINDVDLSFFDEFQVTDIVDAMLMSRLFTELFERGLIIFSTSNRVPDDLYKNGLQRLSFLPFIDILKKNCEILCLDSNVDYRKLAYPRSGKLFYNSDTEIDSFNNFIAKLIEMEGSPQVCEQTIDILDRKVVLKRVYNRLLDTDFGFMCEEARGPIDYLKFCKLFDTIILREIPIIKLSNPNHLRRFITFIDALYDNRIRLICSGNAKNPKEIFDINSESIGTSMNCQIDENVDRVSNGNLNQVSTPSLFTLEEELFAIDRTISRLIEMQSEVYWNDAEKLREERRKQKKFRNRFLIS